MSPFLARALPRSLTSKLQKKKKFYNQPSSILYFCINLKATVLKIISEFTNGSGITRIKKLSVRKQTLWNHPIKVF